MEEMLLSTEGVEERYFSVREILHWHKLHIFIRTGGPYIPIWVTEFYSTFGDLVPEGKKKASAFRRVKLVIF